jgi:hypothetical protein
MSTKGASQSDSRPLVIELDSHGLRVSYVSSMLRVVQAAVREVARGVVEFRPLFDEPRSPHLLLSAEVAEGKLSLSVSFAEPGDSAPMPDLSALVFELLMERFARLLEDTTQLGLWGRVIRGAGPRQLDSGVDRRLSELRTELRHFDNARVSFGGRAIVFEGDLVRID